MHYFWMYMNADIYLTKDGSTTLVSRHFGQFYHNPNGAATENLHVFFEASGLLSKLKNTASLTILEIGFGTGLNFILLLDICRKLGLSIPIRFYSVEAFPVDIETARQIDFRNHLYTPELNDEIPNLFNGLKKGINTKKVPAFPEAELHLFVGEFTDFDANDLKADFIFHDPFSPEVNGELWTPDIFQKIADFSHEETVLTTYCAATKARGAMAASGWLVARAPGALGKREMTIAARKAEKLAGYKRVNEEKLVLRYQNGEFS